MNVVAMITSIVAIGEVIIKLTKEKVKEKISPTIWCMLVLFIVSIGAIIFQIVFNKPTIDFIFVIECIFILAICVGGPLVSYEGAKQFVEKLKDDIEELLKVIKPIMKEDEDGK